MDPCREDTKLEQYFYYARCLCTALHVPVLQDPSISCLRLVGVLGGCVAFFVHSLRKSSCPGRD